MGQHREVIWCGLMGRREVVGGRTAMEGVVYVYIELTHFVVKQRVMQLLKAIALQ